MKQLVLLLIFIFGMNLLGEVIEGHCSESCASEWGADQLSATGTSSSSQDFDLHTCHFGHCSHVMLQQSRSVVMTENFVTNWHLPEDHQAWRCLSLFLRPPIA